MPRSDQGLSQNRYSLIPRCLIFITRHDRVLLLKGAPDKRLWPGRYNGVGGHIEKGEDVLSAAHRELLEETGLSVPDLWICGVITVDAWDQQGIGIYVIRGETMNGIVVPSVEGSLEWIRIKDIGDHDLVEDLYVLLPYLFGRPVDGPPFSAHYTYNSNDELVIDFAD